MVNEYMKYAQLPKPICAQLREYYSLWFPSKRSFDETEILAELSRPLRSQVALHSCRTVLEALQLISSEAQSQRRGLPEAISLNLQRVVYVAGDYIIREGEEPEGMFFVSKGHAEVRSCCRRVCAFHSGLGPAPDLAICLERRPHRC